MKSFKELYLEISKNEALRYIPNIVQRMNAGEPSKTTTTSAPFVDNNSLTRAQIKRNLAIISKKSGKDYAPIVDALNDQHVLSLLDQLLKDLMA